MNSEIFVGTIKKMAFGNEGTDRAYCRLTVQDSESQEVKYVVAFGKDVEDIRERDIQSNECIRVKGRPVGKIVAECIDRVVESTETG